MTPSPDKCIAFKHLDGDLRSTNVVRSGGTLILVPCGDPVERRSEHNARFCRRHEQAYREILFGILEDSRTIPHRER